MKGRRTEMMLCLGLSLIMATTGLRVDRVWTRRGAMIAGGGLLTAPRAAPALFESPAQLAVISLATAQQKLRGLIDEVAEVKRRRIKMAPDLGDDAYVFRFARSVLDPAGNSMTQAAAAIASGQAADDLVNEYKAQIEALDRACRSNEAGDELEALTSAEKALASFLDLAAKAKYDVKPKDDINSYEGAVPVLYNKFLFRSG